MVGAQPHDGRAAGGEHEGKVYRQQEGEATLSVEDHEFGGGLGPRGGGALARAGAPAPRTLWSSCAGDWSARVRSEKDFTVASGTPIRVKRLFRS